MNQTPDQGWKISLLATSVLLTIVFTFDPLQRQLASRSQTLPTPNTTTAKEQKPTTTLSFQPRSLSINENEAGTLEVSVSSPSNVSAVGLTLSFDQNILKIKEITPGNFFTNPVIFQEQIDNKKGRAVLRLGSVSAKSGSGTVAQLKIEGVKKGTATLSMAPETTVAVTERNASDLAGTASAQILVK